MTAWGTWKKDPARALGNVTYNGITMAVPETKVALAGKTGAALKTSRVADTALRVARMGNRLDLIGHGFNLAGKGVGEGIKGIADLTAGLRNTPGVGLNVSGLDHGPYTPASPTIHLSKSDPAGLGNGVRHAPHPNLSPHGAGHDLPTHGDLPPTARKPTVTEVHQRVKEILDEHRPELGPKVKNLDRTLGAPELKEHAPLHIKPKQAVLAGPHDRPEKIVGDPEHPQEVHASHKGPSDGPHGEPHSHSPGRSGKPHHPSGFSGHHSHVSGGRSAETREVQKRSLKKDSTAGTTMTISKDTPSTTPTQDS